MGKSHSSSLQNSIGEARLGRRVSLWPANWRYHNQLKVIGFLFTLPVLIYFLVFNVYPIFSAFVISFFKFDLFSPMEFVGFGNYAKLATDSKFWAAIRVTLSFMVFFGPPAWLIGFVLAMVIKDEIIGRAFFRSIFFTPTILSAVAMATAWSLLFRQNGPINGMLDLAVPWLTNQKTALSAIVIMSIWQGVGWFMVVFLAGLQSIPETYYEAARIDGAGRWQLLRYITLPLLRPVFALVVIQTIIAGMKVFTPMFIMTGGGPNNATRSVAMLIYHEGLRDLRMGQASAISVIGFILVLILTIIQLRLFRVHEEVSA